MDKVLYEVDNWIPIRRVLRLYKLLDRENKASISRMEYLQVDYGEE